MEMYFCKLVNNGIVIESFYRGGENEAKVKESLERFQWPDGTWKIFPADDDDDENV